MEQEEGCGTSMISWGQGNKGVQGLRKRQYERSLKVNARTGLDRIKIHNMKHAVQLLGSAKSLAEVHNYDFKVKPVLCVLQLSITA